MKDLDDLIRIPPFHEYLGVKVVAAETGRVVLEIPPKDAFVGNPLIPAVHGGIISALVDLAGGAALFVDTHFPTPTVDMRLDFLRPAIAGRALRAEAVTRSLGKRVAFVDVLVWQPPGDATDFADAGIPGDARLVAEGRCVYSVVREAGGEPPAERYPIG